MELIECTREYWEFVRLLRTHPLNQGWFLTQPTITPEQQIEFMEKHSHKYKICILNNTPVGYIGLINQNEITNKIINLKDPSNYNESDILKRYNGIEVKIPLLISVPLFYFLNLFSFLPNIYTINCLLTKMLKSNTYE